MRASGGLLCPVFVLAAVQIFMEKWNEAEGWWAYAAPATYAVYLLHPFTNACALYAYVAFYDATHADPLYFRDDDRNAGASTTRVGEGYLWAAALFVGVGGVAVWPFAHFARNLPAVGGLM